MLVECIGFLLEFRYTLSDVYNHLKNEEGPGRPEGGTRGGHGASMRLCQCTTNCYPPLGPLVQLLFL